MATQFHSQLPDDVLDTIQENSLTQIAFRIGETDKRRAASIMGEGIEEADVVNLKQFHAYVRLAEGSGQSPAVLVKTLPPKTAVRGVGHKLGELPDPLSERFALLLENRWPEHMEDGVGRLAFITKVLALPAEKGISVLTQLDAGRERPVSVAPEEAEAMRDELLLGWVRKLSHAEFSDLMDSYRVWATWRRDTHLAQPTLEANKVKRIKVLSRLALSSPWWESGYLYAQGNGEVANRHRGRGEKKYYL